jgi:tagaturonate reductase
MKDEKLSKFLQDTLTEEIVPFVSNDIAATTVFAESITERFLNPYLNHLLTSISLNSISKWRARDLPSFKDYYEKYGKIPALLTVGFSYLMAIYSAIEKRGEEYIVKLPSREITIQDDKPYLDYFADKKPLVDFMKDVNVWGEDLTAYAGFADAVKANLEKIKAGKELL